MTTTAKTGWAEHALTPLQAAGHRRGGARTAVVEALAAHDCAVTALDQAISAHVSAAQAKLGDEHGVHALIEINNLGASFAGGSGQYSPREQRTSTNSARSQGFLAPSEVDKAVSVGALVSAGSGHTLDIRA